MKIVFRSRISIYRKFSYDCFTLWYFRVYRRFRNPSNYRTAGNGPFTVDIVVDAETSSPIAHYRELLSYRVVLFSAYFQFVFSNPVDACQCESFSVFSKNSALSTVTFNFETSVDRVKTRFFLPFDISNVSRIPVSYT